MQCSKHVSLELNMDLQRTAEGIQDLTEGPGTLLQHVILPIWLRYLDTFATHYITNLAEVPDVLCRPFA